MSKLPDRGQCKGQGGHLRLVPIATLKDLSSAKVIVASSSLPEHFAKPRPAIESSSAGALIVLRQSCPDRGGSRALHHGALEAPQRQLRVLIRFGRLCAVSTHRPKDWQLHRPGNLARGSTCGTRHSTEAPGYVPRLLCGHCMSPLILRLCRESPAKVPRRPVRLDRPCTHSMLSVSYVFSYCSLSDRSACS